MEIQISVTNKQAAINFAKWFREEGFEIFSKSKYNKLTPTNTDAYVTCLATDEKLTEARSDEYAGQYFEIE